MRRLKQQRQGREEEREERDTAEGVRRRWENNLNESRRGGGVDKMQRKRERERQRQEVGKRAGKETEGEESETAVCA